MKTAVVTQSRKGKELATRIVSDLPDCLIEQSEEAIGLTIKKIWTKYDCLICIMPTDLAVRSIAPISLDKSKDPSVIVVDEKGEFVVELLFGHGQGMLKLVEEVAGIIGAQSVITSKRKLSNHIPLEKWASDNELTVNDPKRFNTLVTKRSEKGFVTLYSDIVINSLPQFCKEVNNSRGSDLIVSHKRYSGNTAVRLCPQNLVAGLSFNGTVNTSELHDAVAEVFEKMEFDVNSLCGIASMDLNSDSESLHDLAAELNCPLFFYSKDELNSVSGVSTSVAVLSSTGAKGVAEPAAILGATTSFGQGRLIIRKQKWKDVTVAVAEKRVKFNDPQNLFDPE